MDDRLYLQIKLKSLAAEARIIRDEETRQMKRARHWSMFRDTAIGQANAFEPDDAEKFNAKAEYHRMRKARLREHRLESVRRECRATHLAYGFIRGLAYAQLERDSLEQPMWSRVDAMIKKYAKDGELWERYATWRDAAKRDIRLRQTWWDMPEQVADRHLAKEFHRSGWKSLAQYEASPV